MREIYLSKIEPDANEYRMYRLALPDGSKELLRQWGRIGDYVTEEWVSYDSHEAAAKAFYKLERAKRKEGYSTADKSVLPKNYLLYSKAPRGTVGTSGQLSFLD